MNKFRHAVYALLTLLTGVSACGAGSGVAPDRASAGTSDSTTAVTGDGIVENGRIYGAGAAALFTCSGHFIAGRSLEQILRTELTEVDGVEMEAVQFPWKPEINTDERYVSMKTGGGFQPMYAVHRKGLGCTLLPQGTSPQDIRGSLPMLSYERSSLSSADPFEEAVATDTENATVLHVRQLVNAAFDTERYNPRTRSVGIVVIHEGRVIAERYREGFGPSVQYRSWSAAKSMGNALVGVAMHDGLIADLDTGIAIPESEWAREDPRRAITLRNAMHMASGLETENPSEGNQTYAVYFAGANAGTRAASQQPVAAPGTRYHYSNYDTLLLSRHLREVIGDDQAYLDFPYRRLFDRIGMTDTYAETDAYGNYIISSQVYTTPRDLARLGLLFLNDGIWNGERVLPEGWVEFSCTANGLREDRRYAAQWWLAYPEAHYPDMSLPKVCYANGARGQMVGFVPELDLVIARMGIDSLNHWEWSFDEGKFFSDVVYAVATGDSPLP
ncbi:MAG: serine hydrolase [Pseudomonadota bacterium]